MVVRRDVDVARPDGIAVARVLGGQRPGARQHLRQHAPHAGREVPDDEHGGRQVARQPGDQFLERVHAAGRGADHDDVLGRHCERRMQASRRPRVPDLSGAVH